jgi:putative membrane protein
MTDLVLACLHHLLVFGVAAVIAAELATVRPGLSGAGLKRLAIVDAHYGLLAALIIVIGVLRVNFGAKGAAFYVSNPVFWAKMGAFALVGLLSVSPTLRIMGWRRLARADPAFALPAEEVDKVRRFLVAEVCVFALIPLFAAAMARGVGL